MASATGTARNAYTYSLFLSFTALMLKIIDAAVINPARKQLEIGAIVPLSIKTPLRHRGQSLTK
jgi:hypothetical protein